jgi:hypothetical protein
VGNRAVGDRLSLAGGWGDEPIGVAVSKAGIFAGVRARGEDICPREII